MGVFVIDGKLSMAMNPLPKLRIVTVAMLMAFAGCQSPQSVASLRKQPGGDHRLALIFEGEEMHGTLFPDGILLEDGTGRRTPFKPHDPASIEQSAFAYQPVWSPGGKWLLLPNGRFEGFVAYQATDLPAALNDQTKARFIGVGDASGTKWWHEFGGWKTASVFRFTAGLSGDLFPFECDLSTGAVKSTLSPPLEFRKFSQ